MKRLSRRLLGRTGAHGGQQKYTISLPKHVEARISIELVKPTTSFTSAMNVIPIQTRARKRI